MGVMAQMLQEMWQKNVATLPGQVTDVPTEWLVSNPHQPRKTVDPQALAYLAASIQTHGILHPLLVRPLENMRYQIISGERRYRAALMLALPTVPVKILENCDEKQLQALALIENLQRQNLNPVEETQAILHLLALEFNRSPEEAKQYLFHLHYLLRTTRNVTGNVSEEVERVRRWFEQLGMNWRSFLRNRLPLLSLPPDLEKAVVSGQLKYTTALLLKSIEDPQQRQDFLQRALQGESLQSLRLALRGESWHRGLPQKLKRLSLDRLSETDRQELERKVTELTQWLAERGYP